jgi:orotate phosphoribosyltransferase
MSQPPGPSQVLSPDDLAHDRQGLLALLTRLAYEKRRVVLASGRESDFYIDTKQASLTAEGHFLVGRLVLARILADWPDVHAVGGMTMGADPIASAVSLTSFLWGRPLPAFYVRKEPKGHGTNQWLEGKKAIPPGARVAVVEDVVTTGGSTLKAVERIRSEGFTVAGVVALVDRQEGGREAVQAAGITIESLFVRSDFP